MARNPDILDATSRPFELALIDEATCIGCTLCIQACPTDAIVGAAKLMHTVLPRRCTGCELCLPPCPVDCIAMVPAGRDWSRADADRAREHEAARRERLARGRAPRRVVVHAADDARAERRAAIAAALARARARRSAVKATGR